MLNFRDNYNYVGYTDGVNNLVIGQLFHNILSSKKLIPISLTEEQGINWISTSNLQTSFILDESIYIGAWVVHAHINHLN